MTTSYHARALRTAIFVLFGVIVVSLTGGGSTRAGASPFDWKVTSSPFRLVYLEDGKPLLGEHPGPGGPGTRLSYRVSEGGAMHTLTTLVGEQATTNGRIYTVETTEPNRVARVAVTRTQAGLGVALTFSAASTHIRTIYESFDSTPSEHFLGGGERRDAVDLRGRVVSTKVWAGCGNSIPAPFYLSSAGYGVRFMTSAVGQMAFATASGARACQGDAGPCAVTVGLPVVQACFNTDSLAYEVYAGTPESVVRSYASRTGRPPLPEPAQFALTKWRDVIGSEADLTEDADRFATAGIPLGWLIIDNPWERLPCVGSMSFDRRRLPDPSATIAALHARDIRVMLWVSPYVQEDCIAELYPPDRVYGSGHLRAIDLTDPAVAATFEQRLKTLLAVEFDGFKVDRGDEVDLENRTLASGDGSAIHNTYPLLVARSIDRAVRATRGKPLPTLYRAGYMGSQSLVTGSWSGDLPGDWGGLEEAIHSAQTAGLTGFSTWGSDVGGYNSNNLSAPVFVRWAQLGAISPVFEVGGVGANATPWTLGDEAMAGLKKAAVLHYELFPTLYQLARRASATGIPVLRPLALRYPDDPRAWGADREILVGPNVLAAPVTSAGTSAQVYLPAGDWVDLASGATVRGPRSLRRPTPLDELPLYLRTGTAIPYNLRSPGIWRSPWGLNDLFRVGRGGWMIAPNASGVTGDSAEYGAIRGSVTATGLRLVLSRAPRETQVVIRGRRPRSIMIDGRVSAPSPSAAALRLRREGWLSQGPRGGAVLKLVPTAGRAVVTLTY